ncbi:MULTISPECIES: hypothetical protein [Ruminococcus]|uniref:Uncharacterized protein n=1 Tax=Ruminococcus albus 8 TaxID=246199 RepID=E9S971_RUMAL|nr:MULTISPECIES: hypothetical protein [Ruminococcus]EGC04174.1 hypothetical protein CUS_4618 [Ruminococcus albus 8]MBE6872724.1 hypothetical protein [Ruminococcus albus]MCC3351520.1 hypothetical protein [Ruminococcus albus 8]
MNKIQSVLNDEESMKQIRELAGMLSTDQPSAGEQPAMPTAPQAETDIDPVRLMQLGQVLRSASREDDNVRLLNALRPLLREETQLKLDRVIKLYRLMNLYPALKQSGLGGGDLLGLL